MDVRGERLSEIGHGLVVLLGVGRDDKPEDGERLARKIAELRVFADDLGRLQSTVADVGGGVLAIPQFTLYGDVRRGRRPDFTAAAAPEVAGRLYEAFCGALRAAGITVAMGRFGASMRVHIEADGPVTIVAATDRWLDAEL